MQARRRREPVLMGGPIAFPSDSHLPPMPAGLVVAGIVMVAMATVAGAWLARRHRRQQEMSLGAAAGALPRGSHRAGC